MLCYDAPFSNRRRRKFRRVTEALFMSSTAVMCTIIYIFLYTKLGVLSEFIRTARIRLSESKYIDIWITFQLIKGKLKIFQFWSDFESNFINLLTIHNLFHGKNSEISFLVLHKKGMQFPDSKRIFDEAVEQVEKWSKIMTFATQMAPLCGVLSRAAPSFFFYSTTDMGNEAFALPVPMW